MRKADVVLGRTYIVKVSGKLAKVRLDRECTYGSGWLATNVATGREIRIRSAARLRGEAPEPTVKPATPQASPSIGPPLPSVVLSFERGFIVKGDKHGPQA